MNPSDDREDSRLLWSAQETARRLCVHPRTLERETRRKKFPSPVKVGVKNFYRVEDVLAHIKGLSPRAA